MEIFMKIVSSGVGELVLCEHDGALCAAVFAGRPLPPGRQIAQDTPLLLRTERQLAEYFAGVRRVFDVPLRPMGTDFQLRVWQALKAIPYGETRTYGQIAAAVGAPRACRAVGMANHMNPLPLFIPCHRVVGKDGNLVGYNGGVQKKAFLLAHEGIELSRFFTPFSR